MNLSFVDVETTGVSAKSDRIIEIGIIRVEKGNVVAKYNQLINPEVLVPEFIQNMTGITDDGLEGKPTFRDVKDEVSELLNDSIFVAHNVGFDHGFISHEFEREGMTRQWSRLCTVQLSRRLYPQYRRHNLDSIINRFGFNCDNRHRAYDDASILWNFYQRISSEFSLDVINEMISSNR